MRSLHTLEELSPEWPGIKETRPFRHAQLHSPLRYTRKHRNQIMRQERKRKPGTERGRAGQEPKKKEKRKKSEGRETK